VYNPKGVLPIGETSVNYGRRAKTMSSSQKFEIGGKKKKRGGARLARKGDFVPFPAETTGSPGGWNVLSRSPGR